MQDSLGFIGPGVDNELRQRVKESSLHTAASLTAIEAILVKRKLTTIKELESLTAAALADMDRQAEELKNDTETLT